MPLLGKNLTFVIAVLVWINSPTNEMCSLGNQGSPCLIAHTIACIILGFKWWQIRVERMRFLRNWNECPSCAGNKQTYQGFWRDPKSLGVQHLFLLVSTVDTVCSQTSEESSLLVFSLRPPQATPPILRTSVCECVPTCKCVCDQRASNSPPERARHTQHVG